MWGHLIAVDRDVQKCTGTHIRMLRDIHLLKLFCADRNLGFLEEACLTEMPPGRIMEVSKIRETVIAPNHNSALTPGLLFIIKSFFRDL